ncbi:MAG: RsmE family RNA methyltransferase [Desertimonas sp.]
MDRRLRSAAAHVVVADVARPALDDADDHHLRRVLRLRDGAAVTVTDGAGAWRPCRWCGDTLSVDGEIERVAPPATPVTIAVAPPKGDRLDWLVQKVTEIGVDHIALLDADHSVVRLRGERAGRQVERLERIARQAVMQSRRVFVPKIASAVRACDVLPTMVAAEPGGPPPGADDRAIAIGPEGGWSDRELGAATATVSLGPNILRVETAAVVAAVLIGGRSR